MGWGRRALGCLGTNDIMCCGEGLSIQEAIKTQRCLQCPAGRPELTGKVGLYSSSLSPRGGDILRGLSPAGMLMRSDWLCFCPQLLRFLACDFVCTRLGQ